MSGFTLEMVEAIRSCESDTPNGSETDPRVYVCVWMKESHMRAMLSAADLIEQTVLQGMVDSGEIPVHINPSWGITSEP